MDLELYTKKISSKSYKNSRSYVKSRGVALPKKVRKWGPILETPPSFNSNLNPIRSDSLSSLKAKQDYSKVHQNQLICWWKIFSKCFLELVLHKEPKFFWIFKIRYYLGVRFAPIRLVHLKQNRLIPKYIRINLFVDEKFFLNVF